MKNKTRARLSAFWVLGVLMMTVPVFKATAQTRAPGGFVLVAAGYFQMGGTMYEWEKPVHSVTLTKDFYMCDHEVTQAEFQAVMGINPSANNEYTGFGIGGNYPVYYVNWYQAIAYCNKLSLREGRTPAYSVNGVSDWAALGFDDIPTATNSLWDAVTWNKSANGYRLPTEAEWEYAARGGRHSKAYTYSGSNVVGDVAWYYENSSSANHPVKMKSPNELGIYDMSGNVWEWCWDRYGAYDAVSRTDPSGVVNSNMRVGKGGSWHNGPSVARYVYRLHDKPTSRTLNFGFRIACY